MTILANAFRKRTLLALAITCGLAAASGCAPRPRYRATLPSITPAPAVMVPPAPPPPVLEPARKPLSPESTIREQDLKIARPSPTQPPAVALKETTKPSAVMPESNAPLPDDSSLLAKITPATSPRRAASLRLTEEGRRLLEGGDTAKALSRLEKTIVIDSTNAYGYFYLAKTQNRLGRYKESLNFLEVAESRFSDEPFWLAEVHALRGENFRALGMLDKAETSYAEALRLNSGNRTANDAQAKLQGQSQSTSR